MRISEPLGLRCDEVDVKRCELRIAGRRTKNGDKKILYLAGAAMDVIKEQHKARSGDFAFHRDGKPLDYWNSLDCFRAACKSLEIVFKDHDGTPREPGWHDLRRTFARNARRAGIPDNQIMEIAGWKSHQMLIRYLGSVKETDQRLAFNAMDTFFRKARISQSRPGKTKRI
jgi:integrase